MSQLPNPLQSLTHAQPQPQNQCTSPTAIHMVIAIVDRGKGEKITALYQKEKVAFHFITLGHGTARTEMLNVLGIGETKKDFIFSFVPEGRVSPLLDRLADRMKMRYPGKGIAFAIPLGSMSGKTYRALTAHDGENEERKESNMAGKFEMIIVLINRGHTDLVMEAARKEGATGGTVLSTRGVGGEEIEKFLGITIQPEMEMVLMIVHGDKRQGVMKAIARDAGLSTPAQGIVLSLPVTDAIGLV